MGKLRATVTKRQDGTVVNALVLDGLSPNADVKQTGAKLNQLADKARTGGDYEEIGSLYGFQLLVKPKFPKRGRGYSCEPIFVQGEGNIKYTFNNGVMAKDPETASLNF